jgi:hypothetical protein
MPYYIYRVTEFPIRKVEKLEQYDVYREASARVKQMRKEMTEGSPALLKMIHAESELHAEDLLNQVREPAPELGDD